jgi:hypothetical protein
MLAAVVGLAAYGAWHVSASVAAAGRLADVLWLAVGVLLLVRFGWARTAAVLAVALTLVVLQQHIDSSYGVRGGDLQFDGVKRMQLAGNDLVRRVASDTSIQPGDTFRGYVEDVYQRLPSQGNIGDELVEHWHYNWDHYDSGQTLFSWGLFDIPTISEYDPFVKPLYYLFFTRLLNDPKDQQLDNYLGATRINSRIMALMGVRYVVTDRDDASGLDEVARSGQFRVLQTAHPNLGTYSPTQVARASSAADVLGQLEKDSFDPQQQVILSDPREVPPLVQASSGKLHIDRGGFHLSAASPDWSLIVLPIQYTHCFALAEGSPGDAQLLRANLAQTALLFHGTVTARVEYRHWPLASPACQAQDYADTRALRVTEVVR